MDLASVVSSETLKPHDLAFFNNSTCESPICSSETIAKIKQSNGRLETSVLSCSFRVPEAVFLGFLNKSNPSFSRALFNSANPNKGIRSEERRVGKECR